MGCLPSKPEAPAFRAGAGATFRPGGPDERKELEVVRHAALRVSAAACRMQGWRRTQEDVAVALPGAPDAPDALLCGVFDGHSGSVSATLAAARMFPAVLRTKAWGAGDAEAALVQGFLDVDVALREARARDGTTAVCAVVAARALWVANCGDSRALLCRGGRAVALSADHKPDAAAEAARIRAAGGFVDASAGRVARVMAPGCCMAMATSRTLGDFHFKADRRRPPEEQIVSPQPTIVHMERHPEDQFMVLASDGVFDVMSNQDVCDFLCELMAAEAAALSPPSGVAAFFGRRSRGGSRNGGSHGSMASPLRAAAAAAAAHVPSPLKRGGSASGSGGGSGGGSGKLAHATGLGHFAQALLGRCLARGSMDNCTVVLVDLRETPEAAAAAAAAAPTPPALATRAMSALSGDEDAKDGGSAAAGDGGSAQLNDSDAAHEAAQQGEPLLPPLPPPPSPPSAAAALQRCGSALHRGAESGSPRTAAATATAAAAAAAVAAPAAAAAAASPPSDAPGSGA